MVNEKIFNNAISWFWRIKNLESFWWWAIALCSFVKRYVDPNEDNETYIAIYNSLYDKMEALEKNWKLYKI